jgi:phospholipid/cholesterol/gamma-HCH transport system ATP-binding protein
MKCLIGLHTPEQGEIFYDGRPFTKMSSSERKHLRTEIGMLFQSSALFDNETVLGNVMFPLNMFTDMSYEEKLERVNFCLNRVNLKGINHLATSELSGGMMKRVAIARAISNSPKYLFCDEPNSGLDPVTSELIDDLISEITEEYNMTTIINTHDINSVLKIGQTINFLYKGKLWWRGDNKSVLDTDNKELNDFLFSTELTRRIKTI